MIRAGRDAGEIARQGERADLLRGTEKVSVEEDRRVEENLAADTVAFGVPRRGRVRAALSGA